LHITNHDGRQEIAIGLLVRFIGGHLSKTNKSIMLVGFSSLPHGFEFVEGTNIHDQDEPTSGELVMSMLSRMLLIWESTLDLMPP
jgi:hypothetical protein